MAIFRLKKLTIINYFYFPWHQDIDDIQYLNLIEIQFQIGRKLKDIRMAPIVGAPICKMPA